jgi:hypothetical protein
MSLPLCVPPTQTHELAVQPEGPDSDNVYTTPAFTGFGPRVAVGPEAGEPVPLNPPLPVAVSVQSAGCAGPPLSLVTVFTTFNPGAIALLVIVH